MPSMGDSHEGTAAGSQSRGRRAKARLPVRSGVGQDGLFLCPFVIFRGTRSAKALL
jgi:hypothetical protein